MACNYSFMALSKQANFAISLQEYSYKDQEEYIWN